MLITYMLTRVKNSALVYVCSFRILCFKRLVSEACPWVFIGQVGERFLAVNPLSKIFPGFMPWTIELNIIFKRIFYFSEPAFQKFACMSVHKHVLYACFWKSGSYSFFSNEIFWCYCIILCYSPYCFNKTLCSQWVIMKSGLIFWQWHIKC